MTFQGCERCEFGWRHVGAEYAERLFPEPDVSNLDPTAAAQRVAVVGAQRAGVLNSVYPCKNCRPADFFRWAEGHYASDHDRGACGECAEIAENPRRKAKGKAVEYVPDPDGREPSYRVGKDANSRD